MVTYNNMQGKGKVYIRSLIIDLIKTIKPKRTFTLPNLVFDVENIASEYGKVITCEVDKSIFNKQRQINKNKKIELNHGKASEILKDKDFDLVWLDLCGCYSKEFIDCMDNINTKHLVVTLAKARDKFNKDTRNYFYKQLFTIYGYNVLNLIEYNDTFPMQVYFLSKY